MIKRITPAGIAVVNALMLTLGVLVLLALVPLALVPLVPGLDMTTSVVEINHGDSYTGSRGWANQKQKN